MLNQIPRKRKRKLERKETIPLASFQALCREGSQRIQQCRTSQGTPQRSVWGDPQVCQRLPWTPCSWQSVSGCSQSWTPGAVPQTHPGWGFCWSQWGGSGRHSYYGAEFGGVWWAHSGAADKFGSDIGNWFHKSCHVKGSEERLKLRLRRTKEEHQGQEKLREL